jgi:hypothetical protein
VELPRNNSFLCERDPTLFSKQKFKNINKDAPEFHDFLRGCAFELAKKVKLWEGCGKLGGKLGELGDSIVEKT